MQLYYANKTRSYVPFGNFGDDLNPWLWEKLLPGVFKKDCSSESVFVGFGTLLNENLPKFKKTIIFGTGHGFGNPPQIDDSWTIYCVRGPLSARALNLSENLGIADPAILVNKVYPFQTVEKKHKVSLIPYAWEMQTNPDVFLEVCQRLGYFCIDPRWPVEKVLEGISSSQLVVSAAMHGAIAADALRVPWISLKSNAGIPDFKWTDFCQSLDLQYKANRLYRFSRITQTFSIFQKIEANLIVSFIRNLIQNSSPQLSCEKLLALKINQLHEKLEYFKQDLATGKFS